MTQIRILVVGCGSMGTSHALAYHQMEEFEICGLVSRGATKETLNDMLGGGYPLYNSFYDAMKNTSPDAVSINTWTDTHEEYAIFSMEKGCDVFMEKPVSDTVDGTERVIATARRLKKKLVVGYILRHHPSWNKFVEVAQTLGKPLVMRMNLNQQSKGDMWPHHKHLMDSLSPIVDCGVHYVDIMCQMTRSRPVRVQAIGAKLTEEIKDDMYNYGQLQVVFEDGSVGWYEAGWGPMMSETAYFVKDVIGPKGCVSIVGKAGAESESDNIDSHTKVDTLKLHHSQLDDQNQPLLDDEYINLNDEPDHNELCKREQKYFLKSIQHDIDLSEHWADAINAMRIVMAADESVRTKTIVLIENFEASKSRL